MKRIVLLATLVLAVAAVPVALADNGGTAAKSGNGDRIQRLNERVDKFFDRCGTTSVGAPQKCVDVAHKAIDRLQALDAKVQQKLSDHPKLHAIDNLLQKDISRFQAWLGGS
jgi:hypothetical protein